MQFCFEFYVNFRQVSLTNRKNKKMTTTKVRDNVINWTLTANGVRKAVKSCTMSRRYINTMMKATIINILYHRLSIDKKEFVSKNFNNIPYKTFRPKSRNVYIREFHTYMMACKDALDKNYLREFYLYFIDTASGDIVENYKFSFQYAEENEPQHAQKEESLMESTCELLRTLEELGQHQKFDSEIQLKVEFTYFDDTPDDYEPPGFRSINEDEAMMKKINKKGNAVIIGTLFTGFHMLKCRGIGDIFNFDKSPSVCVESENNSEEIIHETEETRTDGLQFAIKDVFTEDFSQPIEQVNTQKLKISVGEDEMEIRMNDTFLSQYIELSSDEDAEINCPCKLPSLNFCKVDEIRCDMCKRTYHSPCQGYLDNSFLSEPFRCFYCTGDDDSIVATLDVKQSMSIYRVRYILAAMYKYGKIPTEFRTHFGATVENLKKLNIVDFDGDRICGVNMDVLNAFFKFTFKSPEMENFKRCST